MNPRYYLYFLAFLEGGCVMAAELIAAKIIAPFLGNSLYVWAALLAASLGGLTLGYYIGGILSRRFSSSYSASHYLLIAAIGILWMPLLGEWVLKFVIDWNILWGSLFSLMIFLFPVLVFMGMTTPSIIHYINNETNSSGRVAGSIYGVSTLGGIIATFTIGFYAMPTYGIRLLCVWIGIVLFVFSSGYLLRYRQYRVVLILFPVLLVRFLIGERSSSSEHIDIIHESEGIFGQIRVIDAPTETYLRGKHIGRTLYVNNIGQSTAFRDHLEYDCWDWSYFFPTAVSMFPSGSKALLMGLGGGTIVHQYNRLGFDIEVVEIDERIRQTAIDYFALSPQTKITIDDARHYINTCTKKYDVITFDMFLNETPPAQVLTLETFQKVKKMLQPNGLWVLNYFGYTTGSKGKSARSIYKTLKAAGLEVEILTTPSESEADRNVIFLSSHQKFDFSDIHYEEMGLPKIKDIRKHFLDLKTLDLEDAELLTDEYPQFDHLYLEPSLDWRKRAIEYQVKPIMDADLKFFK